MKTRLLKTLGLVSLAGLVTPACNVYVRPPEARVEVAAPVPEGEVVVAGAPPVAPPYADVQIASPGVGFVWIPGAWAWAGGRWEWERGRWDHPPRPGMHWVAHHYVYRGGRHVWVRGGWR